MKTTLRTAAALAVVLLASTVAEASPQHCLDGVCSSEPSAGAPSSPSRRGVRHRTWGPTTILGGRPAVCHRFPKTRVRWCGCAAAADRGMDNRNGHWNLASHWLELPRAAPAPGMAAVRGDHVSILRSHISGSIWMAYDPNSGQQLARLHPVDLKQYRKVVDPSGARRAAKAPVPPPEDPPAVPASLARIASADPEAVILAAEPPKAPPGAPQGESRPAWVGPTGPPLRGMPRLTSASPEIVYALDDARDLLVRTATAGGTMLKHGVRNTIERMQPVFVVRLSRAIEEARADPTVCSWSKVARKQAGNVTTTTRVTYSERCLARVGCYSGYRQPGDGVGGYANKFDSNHAYGLACDMHGIGRPGSHAAKLWHAIASRHGLYNPYGTNHRAEWNHYQATPAVKAVARVPELRRTIKASGPPDVVRMWRVADRALYLPEEKARSSWRAKKKIRYAKKHRRIASL